MSIACSFASLNKAKRNSSSQSKMTWLVNYDKKHFLVSTYLIMLEISKELPLSLPPDDEEVSAPDAAPEPLLSLSLTPLA